jgi:hypothetical protein
VTACVRNPWDRYCGFDGWFGTGRMGFSEISRCESFLFYLAVFVITIDASFVMNGQNNESRKIFRHDSDHLNTRVSLPFCVSIFINTKIVFLTPTKFPYLISEVGNSPFRSALADIFCRRIVTRMPIGRGRCSFVSCIHARCYFPRFTTSISTIALTATLVGC